jgi:alkylation response protein AidB-like acyl-CoA dehydrogenase
VQGLDPRLELIEVTGQLSTNDDVLALTPGAWPAAVALSQLALGHELVGTSRRMLELAREHALERVQFGQTISRFQAVRHRLAETLIAIETADALLGSAWLDPTIEAAAMAKSLAGRGAKIVSRHCQQVLAGIGFTTEHDLHHFIRRAFVLDQLFGTAQTLTRDLGLQLLESRQLTPMPPL